MITIREQNHTICGTITTNGAILDGLTVAEAQWAIQHGPATANLIVKGVRDYLQYEWTKKYTSLVSTGCNLFLEPATAEEVVKIAGGGYTNEAGLMLKTGRTKGVYVVVHELKKEAIPKGFITPKELFTDITPDWVSASFTPVQIVHFCCKYYLRLHRTYGNLFLCRDGNEFCVVRVMVEEGGTFILGRIGLDHTYCDSRFYLFTSLRKECDLYRILVDLDAKPSMPYGWHENPHTKGGLLEWNRCNVDLIRCTADMPLSDAIRIAKKQRPFNACLSDFLSQNLHLIPDDWKIWIKHVMCLGTEYEGDEGEGKFVQALVYSEDRWKKHYINVNTVLTRFHGYLVPADSI